jgi:acyl-CoA synthetase (NDP forming)
MRAVVSHTGALAGADRMYDALFERLGVIRAQRYADLLDMSMALSPQRVLRGRRVAILTSTGGAGSLVSDSLGLAGFATPPPDGATAERLRKLQADSQAVLDRNPIDVTLAGLKPDLLQAALDAVTESPGYEAVVVVVGSSSLARPDLVAGVIRNVLPRSDKPILGGRIVLKVLSRDITHKSDVGGVAVDVPPAEVAARLESMAREVQARTGSRPGRFLVQTLISGGIELIVGLHRDPVGAALLVGMGGVTAELLGDHVLRILPQAGGLDEEEALELVEGHGVAAADGIVVLK